MAAIPNIPGRLLLPDLAAADLALDLTRMSIPSPVAPLAEFRAWSDDCARAAAYVANVESKFAPLLCRFCWGFTTSGNEPCVMCGATGLSTEGLQAITRFHHNGE